jgi:anti-sigma factor (TIGR02949 family)
MESMNRMSCEQAMRQFYAYLDHALSGEPLADLNDHLKACLDCCDKLQFSRQLDDFVKSRLGDDPLPEGIEARIRKELADEASFPGSGKKE